MTKSKYKKWPEKRKIEKLIQTLNKKFPRVVFPLNWLDNLKVDRYNKMYDTAIRELAKFDDPRAISALIEIYRRITNFEGPYSRSSSNPTKHIIEQSALQLPYEEANELLFAIADSDFSRSMQIVLNRLTLIINKNGIDSILRTIDSVKELTFEGNTYPIKFWSNTYDLVGELGLESLLPVLLWGCESRGLCYYGQSNARHALMKQANKEWFRKYRRVATDHLLKGFNNPTNVCEALAIIGDETSIPELLRNIPNALTFIGARSLGFNGRYGNEGYDDLVDAIKK